jgi:hypothetical protein
MDEFDMTEEQKIEFLHDLAAIMQGFWNRSGATRSQRSFKEEFTESGQNYRI